MSRAFVHSSALLSPRTWESEAAVSRPTTWPAEEPEPADTRVFLRDLATAALFTVLATVGVTGLAWWSLGSVSAGWVRAI